MFMYTFLLIELVLCLQALEIELRKYLAEKQDAPIFTEVNEVTRVIKIRGIHVEDCGQFLIDCGF